MYKYGSGWGMPLSMVFFSLVVNNDDVISLKQGPYGSAILNISNTVRYCMLFLFFHQFEGFLHLECILKYIFSEIVILIPFLDIVQNLLFRRFYDIAVHDDVSMFGGLYKVQCCHLVVVCVSTVYHLCSIFCRFTS